MLAYAQARRHNGAQLMTNTINTNGTTWLCSNGAVANGDTTYSVLIDRPLRTEEVTLASLFKEYEVLQVDVDGVTLY